jgi:hypothetical protein
LLHHGRVGTATFGGMRLAHLGLTVTDQGRSRRFYETHFGFDAKAGAQLPGWHADHSGLRRFRARLTLRVCCTRRRVPALWLRLRRPAEVRTVRQRLLAAGVCWSKTRTPTATWGSRPWIRTDTGSRSPGRARPGPTVRSLTSAADRTASAGTHRSAVRAKQERRPRHSHLGRSGHRFTARRGVLAGTLSRPGWRASTSFTLSAGLHQARGHD